MYWHKNVYEVNCSDEEYHTKLNALIEMREEFSPDRLAHYTIQLAIVDLIIILLFQTVPVVSYYNLKKQTLNHLKTYFNLTELK